MAWLFLVAMAASSCTREPDLAGRSEDAAREEALGRATTKAADPCPLLEREQIEVALNIANPQAAPVAPRPILVGMKMCTLGAGASFASWGILPKSARREVREYRVWHGDNVERTKVGDHDAIWDPALGTLIVAVGKDRAFGIRLSVEDPPVKKGAGDEKRIAYTKKAARVLAASALARMGK